MRNWPGIAGAAAAHVIVAFAIVLPIYLWELHRAGISWLALAKGVAMPLGCGAAVAAVSLAAQRLISLDLMVLAVAGDRRARCARHRGTAHAGDRQDAPDGCVECDRLVSAERNGPEPPLIR